MSVWSLDTVSLLVQNSYLNPLICSVYLGGSFYVYSSLMLCVERKYIGLPKVIAILHITVGLSLPLTHKHQGKLSCSWSFPAQAGLEKTLATFSCTLEVVLVFIHTTELPAAPDCCSRAFDKWTCSHVLFCFLGFVLWQVSLLLKKSAWEEKIFLHGKNATWL